MASAPTTLFQCQHPLARRRTYRVDSGDVVAVCQVCYSCGAVRSTDEGWWPHGLYLFRDGDLFNQDGSLRISGFFGWRARAPLP